jgi:hypothetical protein
LQLWFSQPHNYYPLTKRFSQVLPQAFHNHFYVLMPLSSQPQKTFILRIQKQ